MQRQVLALAHHGFKVVKAVRHVLGSPKLLSGRRRLAKPADILKFPLLHLDSRADWTNWLQAVCLDAADVAHGPVLNRASMVIDAAINGPGVALARTTLAAWDLITGRLVRPFSESLRLSKTYWVICPKATAALPKIVTFRDWLLAEASSDLRQLEKLGLVGPAAERER
jgi:LysR family transcriptional regulator, glycine cleavage system transcriptional activator